jgi:hypothetical protein
MLSVKAHFKSLPNRLGSISDRAYNQIACSVGAHRFKGAPKHHYLFVLAHPRSGSTLLSHVLSTNPEILSYGENHTVYESENDLPRLLYRTALRKKDYSLSSKYIMDKLVWPKYGMPADIRSSKKTKFIIIIRKPKASFNSMARLLPQWNNEQKAYKSYTTCLNWLKNEIINIHDPSRCMAICYEDLLENSAPIFQTMKTFLEVKIPFSEKYEVCSTTGKLKYGDSSDKIRSGHFKTATEATTCCVSDQLLKDATVIYNELLETMRNNCTSAPVH